ncbi:hypothetical protein GGI17_003979 [Coemansia sp. S146]|nr:hypothetical protein GGI17_003979 [Coemansia sp. S146]
MGDNSRRDAYRLPGIKTLTGSPPRPAVPPLLPQDTRQQPQSLPPPPPPPYYDPQRIYSQQSGPPVPPVPHQSHYSQQQQQQPPPPLPPPTVAGSSRHGAPLPRSNVSSHEYGAPSRQEYPPYQQQQHYSHVYPHAHANVAPPGHAGHGYPYADKPAKYGEQAVTAPTHVYHQPPSVRPGGAYSSGYVQKHVIDSAQPSPGAGPMDVAGMVYSQQRHPAIPSPDQATSPSSQPYHHSHYQAPPPHPSVVSHQPHPSLLPVGGSSQHSPLPRQSQQTIHSHSPHYAHTQQTYSSYASTARESPATNTASYDAYGMPATLPSTPSEANTVVKAVVDGRLASRQQNQKQLAPTLANRPATIASHAPAPLKPLPPLPPPHQPLVIAPASSMYLLPAALASSAISAKVPKSSAAISNMDEDEDDEDEDEDDDGGDPEKGEDDALIKRRKRNALSAARLRERRKNREHELTSSCTKLETQIARLQDELTEEKQRAKLEYNANKTPATGATGDAEAMAADTATSSSASGNRKGTKRQWPAAQTDGEGDFNMSNADEEDGSERLRNPKKKSRPLRELDQVRLDDLKCKIETLGKLNQQVCVNLGMLRQEIQRISNAIVSQKNDRHALAVA